MTKPILFRFYNTDAKREELLPLAQVTGVVRSDEGEESESLVVRVADQRSSYTNNPDTIARFFQEWDIR